MRPMGDSRRVLVLVVLLSGPTAIVRGACRPEDIAALWQLYELTDGASWKHNANWSPDGDPCATASRWVGIGTVDPCKRWYDGPDCAFGRITSVSLDDFGLSGNLSGWTRAGALQNLSYIDLSHNRIGGTLPTELGEINNLRTLTMSHNRLEGTIPTELGLLNAPAIYEELHELRLSHNALSGTLPASLGSHSGLAALDVSHNFLGGELPSSLLGGLTSLEVLYLHDNPQLGGALPSSLGELATLRYLDVSRCALSGTLPPALGQLQLLTSLSLEGSGLLSGTLPPSIGDLGLLRALRLADNRLSGSLPNALGKLRSLETLDLYNNSLTGDVNPSIGNLANLKYMYLDNHHLLPLRKRYCGQRLPNLGKYSYRIVREECAASPPPGLEPVNACALCARPRASTL